MEFRKGLLLFFTIACQGPFNPLLADPAPPPSFQEDSALAGEEPSETQLITAEREIKEKLGKEPGNAKLYYKLSEVYAVLFDRNRKNNAQSLTWLMRSGDALEKAVLVDPDYKVAHYNLGIVNKRLGKMERAREEIKQAIRIALGESEKDSFFLSACWTQIGLIYAEQRFYDEAQEAFEKALEYDYSNDEIRTALADLKEEKKRAAQDPSSSGLSAAPSASFASKNASGDPYYGTSSGTQVNGAAGIAQALPYLGQMFSNKFSGAEAEDDE